MSDTPVLDLVAEMTALSVAQADLDAKSIMLVRLAALIANDAPPISYLANIGAADDAGLEIEDLQGVLIAVAPIAGTARVMTAAANISKAFGVAVTVIEAELAASLEENGGGEA